MLGITDEHQAGDGSLNIVDHQQISSENSHELCYTPTAPKRKRELSSYLTFQQKIRVINKHREDPSISQKKLAEWAKLEFNLPTAVTQGTISNILKNSAKILSVSPNELNTKRKRKLLNEQLDIALSAWVRDMEANCVKISGEAIISKARDFALKMREMDPTATFPDFSAGWLGSFKDRHGIRLSKMSYPTRKKHLVPQYYEDEVPINHPVDSQEANSSEDEDDPSHSVSSSGQLPLMPQTPTHTLPQQLFGAGSPIFFKSDECYLAEAAYASDPSPTLSSSGSGNELASLRSLPSKASLPPSGAVSSPSGAGMGVQIATNSVAVEMGLGMGLSALSGVAGISTSGFSPTDKIIILEQAVNILNEYRLPTKFLRTAQNVIERHREMEAEALSSGRTMVPMSLLPSEDPDSPDTSSQSTSAEISDHISASASQQQHSQHLQQLQVQEGQGHPDLTMMGVMGLGMGLGMTVPMNMGLGMGVGMNMAGMLIGDSSSASSSPIPAPPSAVSSELAALGLGLNLPLSIQNHGIDNQHTHIPHP